MAVAVGSVVAGKYQIVRQVGQGGMGTVFEARHLAIGRTVALKVISDGAALSDAAGIARFQREARMVGAVESRHVVQVLDAGFDEQSGAPYMAMEMLSGVDLETIVRTRGALQVDTAIRIAAQACVGLQRAHQAGITHRDVKSANLFLARGEPGEVIVKVLDFGLAKLRPLGGTERSASLQLTQAGTIMGSPVYMSPEQISGTGEPDARSDIWSLGVVLYEMLCGRAPHADHPTMNSLIVAICTRPAGPISALAPWVPATLDAVVRKALAIEPLQRFASVAEMGAAIQPFLPAGHALDESVLAPRDATAAATPASTGPARSASAGVSAPSRTTIAPLAEPSISPSSGTVDALQRSVAQSAPRYAEPHRARGVRLTVISLTLFGAVGALAMFALRSHSLADATARSPASAPAASNALDAELPSAIRADEPSAPADAAIVAPSAPVPQSYGLLPDASAVPPSTPVVGAKTAIASTRTAPAAIRATTSPVSAASTNPNVSSNTIGGCPYNAGVCLSECVTGNAASCFTYGDLNEKGMYGNPPDYVQALKYYKRACVGGNAAGCTAKDRLEATKPSNAAHDQKILEMWQHECEGAVVAGCRMVAKMYEDGLNGTPRDIVRAMQALQHGCEGGNDSDCSELARLKRSNHP